MVLSPSSSDRFPADLARVWPITTFYLIFGKFWYDDGKKSAIETKMAGFYVERSADSAAFKDLVHKKDVFSICIYLFILYV